MKSPTDERTKCVGCRERDIKYQQRYDTLVDEIIRLQRIIQELDPGEFYKDSGSGKEYREQGGPEIP